jgi:excisionase family DNA binding protein
VEDIGAQYIGASEAARLLGVSPQSIRDWIKDGRLPALRTGIGNVVRVADVQRLAAERATRKAVPV